MVGSFGSRNSDEDIRRVRGGVLEEVDIGKDKVATLEVQCGEENTTMPALIQWVKANSNFWYWSAHYLIRVRLQLIKLAQDGSMNIMWWLSLISVTTKAVYWVKVVLGLIQSLMDGTLSHRRTQYYHSLRVLIHHIGGCTMLMW